MPSRVSWLRFTSLMRRSAAGAPDPMRAAAGETGSEGFIVVAVLWIVAALAALVGVYAFFVVNTATALSANEDAVRADALISAGIELAAYQLLGSPADDRPAQGQFTARVGTARLTVAYEAEAGRIDLNTATKPLLVGLMTSLGTSPFDADGFADRIVAWRTTSAKNGADANPEDSLYRSAGLSYTPRHAPFTHVSELWLVYGLPPDLVAHMLPYVTVYSGQAQVDVLDAAPQVLAALPGISPESLQAILSAREAGELNKTTLPTLLAGAAGAASTDGGKAVRVGVRIDFANGRRSAGEAVIMVTDDGPAPYRVLSWRNAFDGAVDQAMDFGKR